MPMMITRQALRSYVIKMFTIYREIFFKSTETMGKLISKSGYSITKLKKKKNAYNQLIKE